MNDLRKAAEMALETLMQRGEHHPKVYQAAEALRQALAEEALDEMVAENQRLGLYDDKPAVKSYCGGVPNYCTQEVTGEVTGEVQCKTDPRAPHGFNRNASHSVDRYVCECESWEPVDAVNMTPDRVDETAKGEHKVCYEIPDWRPGMVFPAPKREWVGLTDDERRAIGNGFENDNGHIPSWMSFARAIEAKLKEKNGG